MSTRHRWPWAAMVGLPIIILGGYLLWIWPRPRGASIAGDLAPYVLSLVTGLPFAWILGRGRWRIAFVLAYLGAGFVLLWLIAAVILCGVRNVCL